MNDKELKEQFENEENNLKEIEKEVKDIMTKPIVKPIEKEVGDFAVNAFMESFDLNLQQHREEILRELMPILRKYKIFSLIIKMTKKF